MFKVKHVRTADCVVAGFRCAQDRARMRRLAAARPLRRRRAAAHVGVVGAFPWPAARSCWTSWRRRVTTFDGHPWAGWAHGGGAGDRAARRDVSRWNAGKDLSWQPLRPELVVEVAYDHMEGTRFRHTAQFRTGGRTATRQLHVRPARAAGQLRPRRGAHRRVTAGPTRSRRSEAGKLRRPRPRSAG